MSVLYLMIPMSLFLGFGFLFAICWAISRGQFDDLQTPALRMLEDSPEERELLHQSTIHLNQLKPKIPLNPKNNQ